MDRFDDGGTLAPMALGLLACLGHWPVMWLVCRLMGWM